MAFHTGVFEMLVVAAITSTTLIWMAIGQPIPGEGIYRYHVFCYNHTGQHPISCERNSIIKVNGVTRGFSPNYSIDQTQEPKEPVCPVNPSCSMPHSMPGICDTERTCQVSPLTPRAPISHPCARSLNVTHSNYLLFNYSCISVTALSSQMLCEESSVIQSSGHIFSPGFPKAVPPGMNRSCSCIIQAPRSTLISLQSFHLHLAARNPCREQLKIFADQDRQLLYVCSPDYRQPGWSVTFQTSVIRIDYVNDAAGPDQPGGKVWLGFKANTSLWIRCGSDSLAISETLPPLTQYTPEVTTEEPLETTTPRSGKFKITPAVLGGIAAAGFLLIVCIISTIVCTRRANRRNTSKRTREEGEVYAYINPATISAKTEPKEKPPAPPTKNSYQPEPGAKSNHRTQAPSSVYNLQHNNVGADVVQYDTADATYYYYDELQPVNRAIHGSNFGEVFNPQNKQEVLQLLNAAKLKQQQSHLVNNVIPPNIDPLQNVPHVGHPALAAGTSQYYEHLQYDPYTEIPALYAFLDKENIESQQHRF